MMLSTGVLASPSDPKDLAQQPCLTRFSAAEQAAVAKELQQVATTRVVVFVDPLDATKEFTRGVFEVVTTLIGIAVGTYGWSSISQSPLQTVVSSLRVLPLVTA
jgi:fructose-1,6-bisphosphatase/inositol monophosphatase family enzyme